MRGATVVGARARGLLLAVLCVAGNVAWASTTVTLAQITGDNVGEFVTVSGEVVAFYAPADGRSPYALVLKDSEGDRMRLTGWPDIFSKVARLEDLKTTGTAVTVTAEVAEYNDKLELHLQDWEEILVGDGVGTEDGVTSGAR